MTTDELRARFEGWCEQRNYNRSPAQNNCGITVPERYAHPKVQLAWEAWQAAHASRDAEVEALRRDAERVAAQRGNVRCEYCDGTGDVHGIDGEWRGYCTSCPAAVENDFKNFHRSLCERLGYAHDEKDWKRDQVSLIEYIAASSRDAGRYQWFATNASLVIKGNGSYLELPVPFGRDGISVGEYIDAAMAGKEREG